LFFGVGDDRGDGEDYLWFGWCIWMFGGVEGFLVVFDCFGGVDAVEVFGEREVGAERRGRLVVVEV